MRSLTCTARRSAHGLLTVGVALGLALGPTSGLAQPPEEEVIDAEGIEIEPAGDQPLTEEDIVIEEADGSSLEPETPPAPPPPMPGANEDFSADQDLFKEVRTAPEEVGERIVREETTLAGQTFAQRSPTATMAIQGISGLFAGSILGLLGGSVGEAVAPGDENQPLGGVNGPIFGLAGGGLAGISLGVWGAGQLLGREGHYGWSAGGSAAGALVGGGVAAGLLVGLPESNTATTMSVVSFFAFTLGGALLFSELGEPVAPPPPPIAPAGGLDGALVFPLGWGRF